LMEPFSPAVKYHGCLFIADGASLAASRMSSWPLISVISESGRRSKSDATLLLSSLRGIPKARRMTGSSSDPSRELRVSRGPPCQQAPRPMDTRWRSTCCSMNPALAASPSFLSENATI